MGEHRETVREETVADWAETVEEVAQGLRPYFRGADAHQRALAYVEGLLRPTRRKHSWQLAETMGEATPYSCQHLLGRAVWEADQVRFAVSGKEHGWIGWQQQAVRSVLATLPTAGWQRLSAGAGSKAPAGMIGTGNRCTAPCRRLAGVG